MAFNKVNSDIIEAMKVYSENRPYKWSFLNEEFTDIKSWKSEVQPKLIELLCYDPPKAELEVEVREIKEKDGLIYEEITYNSSQCSRIPATVIKPANALGKLPAVVALHCHSGYFYHGRHKITNSLDNPHEALVAIRQKMYEGVLWADELARRGYVVIAADAPYFGERKMTPDKMSEKALKDIAVPDLSGGETVEYITKYNKMLSNYEPTYNKHVMIAGATMTGMLAFDDRAAVDYLFTRDDVNTKKIACAGLSCGGYRSMFLAGTDPRIKCAVVTGWCPSMDVFLDKEYTIVHSFISYVTGLRNFLDYPDVCSLLMPGALFLQQCRLDNLYTEESMKKACEKAAGVFNKAGLSDKYEYKFYENKHELNKGMQKDMFDFIDKNLK